jgi:hypothetical protein
MDKRSLYEQLKQNPKNIHFEKICKIAIVFGFRYRGGKGSHCVYVREGIRELLNFQNVNGKVKPYQVKQFIKIIEKYNLLWEEENNV